MFSNISNYVFSVGRITPRGKSISLLGTAFAIEKIGCFATAAHVVNCNDNDLVIIPNSISSIHDYQDTSQTHVQYFRVKLLEINPMGDVCILQAQSLPLPLLSLSTLTPFSLSSTDNIKVGSEVLTFGYPHCDHSRRVLTQQHTRIGAKILIDVKGIKFKNIILNIQARPGQSGSPIICPATKEIVGMIIGPYVPDTNGGILLGNIDPETLHQTTHAISAEYIKEMLE